MTNMHRRFAATVVLLGALSLPAILGAEIIEQILVKVNGEIFTKSELETRQVAALRQKGLQSDPNDDQLKQLLSTVTPQIMVDAVTEMLLVQRGKELGYRLSDDDFKKAIDNIKREYKLDSDEKFETALKQENMTMSDLRRQFERSMLVQRVEQIEVFGKIGVTEDEARKYYESHLQEFTTPASVSMREVLVAVAAEGNALNVGQDEAAKAKAEQIRARAAGGENFMKLAEDSSDAPSRANAGLIGPLNLSDLSPELRALIEPLKPGDLSPIVRTNRGYQFFKIETLTPSVTMAFEPARDQINDRVFTGKRRDEFDKYLTRMRNQAIIEWKNPDVKKAYEDGLAAQKTAS